MIFRFGPVENYKLITLRVINVIHDARIYFCILAHTQYGVEWCDFFVVVSTVAMSAKTILPIGKKNSKPTTVFSAICFQWTANLVNVLRFTAS